MITLRFIILHAIMYVALVNTVHNYETEMRRKKFSNDMKDRPSVKGVGKECRAMPLPSQYSMKSGVF